MTLRFGLKEEVIAKINGVLGRYAQVERAILYGSRAKGNFKPGSDIDLTLEGPDLTLSVLTAIMTELDDLLLPWMIDLSIHQDIKDPELLDHIQRVGQVFYEKK